MTDQLTSIQVKKWLLLFADRVTEYHEYLNALDTATGDGDHGVNMHHAVTILRERLLEINLDEDLRSPDMLLRIIGIVLINHIGGAAGPLYGSFFLNAADAAKSFQQNNADAETQPVNVYKPSVLSQLMTIFAQGLHGIRQRGLVELGEKTMADTLVPAAQSLRESTAENADIRTAMRRIRSAAQAGMQQTISLKATKGRATYLGARSIGHQDPGATSIYLLIETAAEVFGDLERQPMPMPAISESNP